MAWRERLGLITVTVDGTSSRGTGYWLTRNRVLTARHVLKGNGDFNVQPLQGNPIFVPRDAVLWQGQGALDAALFAAEHPAAEGWGVFPDSRPIERILPCAAAGFARVATEAPLDGSVAGRLLEVSGTLHPPVADRPTLQLTVDQRFRQIDQLKGISGAPVMVDDRLQGVLPGGPKDLDGGILHVVSIHALLTDASFFQKLGLPPITDQCKELWKRVIAFLNQHPDFARNLSRSVGEHLNEAVKSWGEGAAEELADRFKRKFKTKELLELFFGLQAESWANTELLKELLFLLVPLVHWEEFDREQAQITADVMRLPLVEPAFAEIVQAAFDGHPVEFIHLPEDPLRSPRAIDAPGKPRAGASPRQEGEDFINNLFMELVGLSFKGEPFLAPDRFAKTESMPALQKLEQRRIIINEALAKQRNRYKRIFFLLVDRDTLDHYGSSADLFLARVREFFPLLRIVVLAGNNDNYGRETTLFDDLREILQQAKKPTP